MGTFTEVSRASLYESVAASIERAILAGELKQGEKLPSEQKLAEQFGVSRNILREALRAVKARGLLEVKNGDGTYIARPNSTDLGDMLSRLVILNDSAISHYYEVRFALEEKACALAALRATAEDLDALESIIAQMKESFSDKEKLTRLDYEFHLAIAAASKNPLFPSFLQPMKQLMTDMFHYAYPDHRGRTEAMKYHVEIIHAIRSGDPSAAGTAMKRHMENSEKNVIEVVHKDSHARVMKPRRARPRARSTRERNSG